MGHWRLTKRPYCDPMQQCPQGKVQPQWWNHFLLHTNSHQQTQASWRVNYSETFSSTAKILTMWVVLANTATQDWEIDHVDVKSTYLNMTLKETIYIKLPWGVLNQGKKEKYATWSSAFMGWSKQVEGATRRWAEFSWRILGLCTLQLTTQFFSSDQTKSTWLLWL